MIRRQSSRVHVRRVLAVLLLAAGVLAMHTFVADHGSHAPAAVALDQSMAVADPMPDAAPMAEAFDERGLACRDGCGDEAGQIWVMCLAVVTGAAAVALLIAQSRRGTGSLAARRPGWLATTRERLVCRPPRPPSLVLLCIART